VSIPNQNSLPAFDFSGKTAFVTGASGGIGEGIARVLARCNANLVLHTHSASERAQRLTEEVTSLGARSVVIQGDLSRRDELDRLVQGALTAFNRVDFLVNNAGILELYSIEGLTEESWDRVIGINLESTVFLTNKLLQHMREQGNGAIVNIGSSMSANEGAGPEGIPYNISKAGLHCMTKTYARILAPEGIRINAVAPGIIRTPMLSPFDKEAVESWGASIPLRRLGEPDDIGAAVAFLLSDFASYITGQVLHVNGGMRFEG
jgi:3-oxoacyl-[acyl-carrier protein] reductase